MNKKRLDPKKMLQERWEQIQADDMCSDVWRSFAGRTGFYAIAFDYSKYAPDYGEKGRVEQRKALRELAQGYVRLRGSLWVDEQESPIYEAEAIVIYGRTREELAKAVWIAGDDYFLFYRYEKDEGADNQPFGEVKKLIGAFFGDLAKKHGTEIEQATLFRLEERVLRHPFFQYLAGGPYWVTIYENDRPQDLLNYSYYDPRPYLQASEKAIAADISASLLWGEILNNHDSIGVITAHRNGDAEQNFLRHLELKHMIRIRKNHLVEFRAGFYDRSSQGPIPLYQMQAAVVFGMTKKTLMRLARRLGQDIVLYGPRNGEETGFHVLSVHDYYDDPQNCTVRAFNRERGDQVLDPEKRALRGFLAALAERRVPDMRPCLMRIKEEITLPGLHRYHVAKPPMVVNYETVVDAK